MAQVAQGADTRITKYCFIKEVQGRWVDVSYFFEKIINAIAAVVSEVVDSSGMAVIFFLVIRRSLRMTLLICDTLAVGKSAGWTTPSNKSLGCISLE